MRPAQSLQTLGTAQSRRGLADEGGERLLNLELISCLGERDPCTFTPNDLIRLLMTGKAS